MIEEIDPKDLQHLKNTQLMSLTKQLVEVDEYGEYLINTPILHKKTLEILEYGISYFAELENYEECAMFVTLKNGIIQKQKELN